MFHFFWNIILRLFSNGWWRINAYIAYFFPSNRFISLKMKKTELQFVGFPSLTVLYAHDTSSNIQIQGRSTAE